MSLPNEDRMSLGKGSVENAVFSTKQKISYSREYLLSFSSLDTCKKLPSGFDESLISEFEDALIRLPDRPRIGSQPLQGFRRNEYGSSPPTRGDSGSYSRGTYGKWESRGRSDRDSDSQSDRDSDSARRYSHQPRRSWQSPEHDGLLGSGSFPRPPGYSAGISALKVQANEHNQLSRSSEPYHPPRPYKAVPHSRRDTDSLNDETFGSLESTNEDRAEEERKRRASFEMMRKEQQKALQEKQKSNPEKHKVASVFDEVLVDRKEEKGFPDSNDELGVSPATPILSSDLEKPSFAANAPPASRPLIPPGFKSNSLEKSSILKSLIHSSLSEVGKPDTDPDINLGRNTNDSLERRLSHENNIVGGQPAKKMDRGHSLNNGESVNVHVRLDTSVEEPGVKDQLRRVSNNLGSHGKPEVTNAKLSEENTVRDSNRTSVLEKIFGSTLSVDGRPSSTKHHDSKPDDTWSPKSVQSSKFAQWFSEEEAKVASDVSSPQRNDILSLIGSGDKANGISEQFCIKNKEGSVPAVLTCEDLEQSILSQYSTQTTNVNPVLDSWSASGANTEQTSTNVDDHASLELFSMLRKSNTIVNSEVGINSDDRQLVSGGLDMATVVKEPKGEEKSKNLPDLGKALTLENLFGSAFMKELQSADAPVSLQRGSIRSAQVDALEPHGLPIPVAGNGISLLTTDKGGLQKPSHDYSMSKRSEAGNWLGFDDSTLEITSSKLPMEAAPRQGVVDFHLPEEENLISAGDIQDHRKLPFMPTGNPINDTNVSSNTHINITEKLAAFGAAVKHDLGMRGSEQVPFARNTYDQMEPGIPYRNLHAQQSASLFQAPQVSQVRPLHHHLESHSAHLSNQLKFLGQDPMFNYGSPTNPQFPNHGSPANPQFPNHGSPANPQFPSNMIRPPFHHANVTVAGFDVPSQHSMLHQMQMPGNHTPHFQRGGPVVHHGNQVTNFTQEMNQMQGFPFGAHQPNIGSRGMPMPGSAPEALQRLIEMDLRAKAKQIHPSGPGQSQGMFGHEVDLGFRYR